MKPKSQTLFHFTKNLEFVKKILLDGFWPRYCLEDLSWYIHNIDYIAFPMVCFCDIPLSRINEHVAFYGEYGVGVTREWALSNKLNPVSYIANNSNYGDAVNNLYRNVEAAAKYYDGSGYDLNLMLSYFKPVEGRMIVSGEIIEKEFYQESEWRFVPRNKETVAWLSKDVFESQEQLDTHNAYTKQRHMLKISPKDVKYIFVKRDSDIPEIINFIQTSLDHFSSADLKILMSRVVSLESISSDL